MSWFDGEQTAPINGISALWFHPETARQQRLRRLFYAAPVGRHYNPGTGQFLSVDPLVDATEQIYAYTGMTR
jgi:hypothetical protein